MARLTYPRSDGARPAPLPPEHRTVGQLIAETIRLYGDSFLRALPTGVPPTILALIAAHVSYAVSIAFAGVFLSSSYVYATTIVLRRVPSRKRLVLAWLAGVLAFAPVPLLVRAFILPGLAWLAAVGLVVPVLVAEELGFRASFVRAWQLARADYLHAFGSIVTLGIVVLLTQGVLAFLLRGNADVAIETAFVLAGIVLSPLLFVGAALLYVDQEARVE
ncbi:MAG TPA: hypothetical protein VFA56_03415 [Gaiellaceae bacterium]|nr:hypothetical protein [Gaiellaceae bacterium]